MNSWYERIEFERQGPVRRAFKAVLINPLANHLPAGMLRGLLKFGKSELAAANWVDPGGWRSMVISYHGEPPQVADRLLVVGGTMSKALRNRLRLGSAILAHLIDTSEANPVHVLCLGAGPGQIITTAMAQAERPAIATLVDLNSDAFEYGRERAESLGLGERVKFIQGDIREIEPLLEHAPDIVKMLGICEYLTDEQIIEIASAAARVMPAGASIVFNSLSRAHGNDRFFRRVFGLNMIYRTPEELTELMRRSGFEDFQTYPEPLGVYHVIVGHRREPAGEQEGR